LLLLLLFCEAIRLFVLFLLGLSVPDFILTLIIIVYYYSF
jgi:hypothetical protein